MLNGGAQRRALPQQHKEEIKILNISFPLAGMEPPTHLQSHACAAAPRVTPGILFVKKIYLLIASYS